MRRDPELRQPIDKEARECGHHGFADHKAVPVEVLAEHAVKHGYVLIVAFERGHEKYEKSDGRGES